MVRLRRVSRDPIEVPMMIGLGLMTAGVFLQTATLIYAGSICIILGAFFAFVAGPKGSPAPDADEIEADRIDQQLRLAFFAVPATLQV